MGDVAQCLNGPVKAGDMVKVVLPSPCCGNRFALGRVYVVLDVYVSTGHRCDWCGHITRGASVANVGGDRLAYLLPRLIRLDPPALPESIETVREVTA